MGGVASRPPESIAEELVSHTIRDNKVVIFSKRSCGYCDAAKYTLRTESKQLAKAGCKVPGATVIELDDAAAVPPPVAAAAQEHLARITGGSTVPRVFVNGQFIGGATETAAFARAGGLRFALMEAGACKLSPPPS